MRELLVRGKNTIDPEIIDPGGRSVEISPVKIDFTFKPSKLPQTVTLPIYISEESVSNPLGDSDCPE
jgi:hypothetical protein